MLEPLWKGIRLLRGKVRRCCRAILAGECPGPRSTCALRCRRCRRGPLRAPPCAPTNCCPPPRSCRPLQVLAAFLKAIGFIIPLMDAMYANYYTREVMIILIR